jgi:EpsI family protein
MPLADSLSTIPLELTPGYAGESMPIPADQVAVAGTTRSILRLYQRDSTDYYTVYVGYYDQQRQGRTIHSPKNCLPGGGWEPLGSRKDSVVTAAGTIHTNRWTIAKGNERAVVYYWYQGRGRTESDEYRVKLDLIRDSAIRRRSEEALVRILVPLGTDQSRADSLARRAIIALAPHLKRILPT